MKPIIILKQKDSMRENGYIRKFPIVTIYYEENSKFPYIAKGDNAGWIKYHTDKSKNLKTLIKRLNTEVFCISYRKGKYLAEKTIGSNIEIIDNSFKGEII